MSIIYPYGERTRPVSQSVGILPREHAKKRDLSSCSATICRFLRSRFTQAHMHTGSRTYAGTHTRSMHYTKRGRDRGRSPLRIANAAHYEYVTLITETQILGKRIASSRDPWREAARISHISTHSRQSQLFSTDYRSLARSIESPNTHGSYAATYDTTGRTVSQILASVYVRICIPGFVEFVAATS